MASKMAAKICKSKNVSGGVWTFGNVAIDGIFVFYCDANDTWETF